MLGFDDFAIFLVYVLCILSALVCVVYGIFNWNKGDDEISETDKKWGSEEKNIAEKLDI